MLGGLKNYSAAEAIINLYRNTPFKYGTFDCWMFSKQVIEAYHGIKIDIAPDYNGTPGSIRKIFKRLKVKNLNQCLEKIADSYNWKEIKTEFVQPFDLILLKINDKYFAGVSNIKDCLSSGKIGLIAVPKKHIVRAWRISEHSWEIQ